MRIPFALALLALAACATTPREAPPAVEALLALPVDSSRTYDPAQVRYEPRIVNQAVVRRALETNYPAQLRDAGTGGEVMVRFVIDEHGVPQGLQVVRGAVQPEFGAAAIAVLKTARFAPASHHGHRVRVLVTIPVAFMPQN